MSPQPTSPLPLGPGSVQEAICRSMLHNSGIFLRKAAEEIAECNKPSTREFDSDLATLITVLIQISVELASTALVIRYDGLSGVIQKDVPATEAEAEARWRDNTIKTKHFEEVKKRASHFFGDEDFWGLVDDLQLLRNKLVHFHQSMDEDVFDLQYELTKILIQIGAILADNEDSYLPDGSVGFFGRELFDQLLLFEPYRYRIEILASRSDRGTLKCVMCDLKAYSPEFAKCFGCGYDADLRLLTCPYCKRKNSVFYDHLNLPINTFLEALCGSCGRRSRAVHCRVCDWDYAVVKRAPLACPWEEDHEEIRRSQASLATKPPLLK